MVQAWNPRANDERTRALRRQRRGSISTSGVLSLSAIAMVVVLVSLPRLRSFALRENEADAIHLLRTVAESWHATPVEARGLGTGALRAAAADSGGFAPDLAELLRSDHELERRLENCHDLGQGRILRHGYLVEGFELAPGSWALRAWPYRYGQTGRRAFVWIPDQGFSEHLNSDAAFDGPDRPPLGPVSAAAGWRRVRR